MESLIAPCFNLFLLIGILFFKLKQPVKDYVRQRHYSIQDDIRTVREHLKEAQEKYDEFSSKLKAIDAEVRDLREQAKQDVAVMSQRLLSEAKRISTTLISDAQNAANGLYLELKGQLYFDLTMRVLDRAEVLLRERLTGDDRARIRQEFSRQVEDCRR
jgi:F0F1-type ATP synthase membrane subunit b/b'